MLSLSNSTSSQFEVFQFTSNHSNNYLGLTLNGWGFLLPFSYSDTEIKSQNLRDIFRSYFLSRYDSRSSSVTGGISRMKLVHCTSYKHLTKEEIQKKLKEPEKFIVTSSETKIFYICQFELVRKGIDESWVGITI